LFCFGLLYDGYKESVYWWQLTVAYSKSLIVFLCYYFANQPVVTILLAILIFSGNILLEVLFRPWAGHKSAHGGANNSVSRRASITRRVIRTAVEDVKIAKFGALSIYMCLLTSWAGMFYVLSPKCSGCVPVTILLLFSHSMFIIWGAFIMVKTKFSERRKIKKKHVPQSIEISISSAISPPTVFTNPLFKAGRRQIKRAAK
jgi:hypothetical protein